jgi:uncharacterized protein YuzE
VVSVTYDPKAKALYISLDEGSKVAKTIPLGSDRYLDVDENGKAIGLEILFSQDMPKDVIDAILNSDNRIALLTQ